MRHRVCGECMLATIRWFVWWTESRRVSATVGGSASVIWVSRSCIEAVRVPVSRAVDRTAPTGRAHTHSPAILACNTRRSMRSAKPWGWMVRCTSADAPGSRARRTCGPLGVLLARRRNHARVGRDLCSVRGKFAWIRRRVLRRASRYRSRCGGRMSDEQTGRSHAGGRSHIRAPKERGSARSSSHSRC